MQKRLIMVPELWVGAMFSITWERTRLLALCFWVTFLSFWIFFFFTTFPSYCFSLGTIWQNQEVLISPFWSYSLLFGALGGWWLVEVVLLFRASAVYWVAIFELTVLGLLLSLVTIVLLNFLVLFGIEEGTASAEELWVLGLEQQRQAFIESFRPSFGEFLFEEACKLGIDPNGLSPAEEEEWIRRWQDKYYPDIDEP